MFTMVSVIASLFLGIVSNWLYDVFRKKGGFPDRPTFKTITIIAFTIAVFIILNTLLDISDQDWAAVAAFFESTLPLWLVLLFMLLAFIVGYMWRRRKARSLSRTLEELKAKLRETESKLENSERKLDQWLKLNRPPEEPIIRPK